MQNVTSNIRAKLPFRTIIDGLISHPVQVRQTNDKHHP